MKKEKESGSRGVNLPISKVLGVKKKKKEIAKFNNLDFSSFESSREKKRAQKKSALSPIQKKASIQPDFRRPKVINFSRHRWSTARVQQCTKTPRKITFSVSSIPTACPRRHRNTWLYGAPISVEGVVAVGDDVTRQ